MTKKPVNLYLWRIVRICAKIDPLRGILLTGAIYVNVTSFLDGRQVKLARPSRGFAFFVLLWQITMTTVPRVLWGGDVIGQIFTVRNTVRSIAIGIEVLLVVFDHILQWPSLLRLRIGVLRSPVVISRHRSFRRCGGIGCRYIRWNVLGDLCRFTWRTSRWTATVCAVPSLKKYENTDQSIYQSCHLYGKYKLEWETPNIIT